MATKVIFEDLGIIQYQKAYQYQEHLFQKSIHQKLKHKEAAITENYVLFCEHPHVFTLGKSGKEHNLLLNAQQLKEKHVEFYKTNRGGDITYHGYGQLVIYPILDLEKISIGLRQYIENLEEVVIQTLKEYNIQAGREKGASGVWIEQNRKICAIGVRSSRMVTMHGLAFNINTDLKYFDWINPCGFTDKKTTSLQKELERELNIEEVKKKLQNNIQKIFDIQLI